MNTIKELECTRCKRLLPPDSKHYCCPDCQGILEVIPDYPLLKTKNLKALWTTSPRKDIWRYLPLIGVPKPEGIETLRVGNTPLYQANKLGSLLGLFHLYVKDEGLNPTQSLKDRASVVACLQAIESKKNVIACASTGNAASSLAGNAAKLGLKAVIFVPSRAPAGKLAQLLAYDALVIRVDGDYQAAFSLSEKAIAHFGWLNRNAAINPYLIEGKKTVALEIAEDFQFQVPDAIVVSVGDGCTIGGVYKGFVDLVQLGITNKIPRIIGVQAAGCNPFVRAFLSKRPLEAMAENTLADSIAVGIPRNPFKAMRAVFESGGTWLSVSDTQILDAMKLLGKTEGIFSEPAAAASIAGMIQAMEKGFIQKEDHVVCISTGNGLKDTKTALEALKRPVDLKNDFHQLLDYITENKGELLS